MLARVGVALVGFAVAAQGPSLRCPRSLFEAHVSGPGSPAICAALSSYCSSPNHAVAQFRGTTSFQVEGGPRPFGHLRWQPWTLEFWANVDDRGQPLFYPEQGTNL